MSYPFEQKLAQPAVESESEQDEERIKKQRERLQTALEIGYIDRKDIQEVRDSGISDCSQSEKSVFDVHTGKGAILDKNAEVLTDRIDACLTLFASGKEGNVFVHLVPKNDNDTDNLAYKQDTVRTIEHLVESLSRIGNKEDISITLVGNSWSEGRKYREQFLGELADSGFSAHIRELPYQTPLTVYYNPQDPEHLVTIGRRFGKERIDRIPCFSNENAFFDVKESLRSVLPETLQQYLLDDTFTGDFGPRGLKDMLHDLLFSENENMRGLLPIPPIKTPINPNFMV